MSAAKLNIKIDIGATWELPLTWKSGGIRVPLTGYTAKMQIRDRIGGSVLIELSTENQRILLEERHDSEGSTVGVISLILEANATDDITNTTGTYDLKLYSPGSPPVETRLLRGSVTFSPAVTVDSEA